MQDQRFEFDHGEATREVRQERAIGATDIPLCSIAAMGRSYSCMPKLRITLLPNPGL